MSKPIRRKKKKVVFKFDERSLQSIQEVKQYYGMVDRKPYPSALRLAAFDELKDAKARVHQLEQEIEILKKTLGDKRLNG